LPHNFNELIDASIDVLRGKKTHILPDFPTGGLVDCTDYNHGLRGGKIRCRSKIKKDEGGKTLVITEIPFGTTTSSLIDSILKANDKGKIKIKKIEDNTAEHVEIIVHLAPGVSPDKTIDALFAFTDCEISISPNSCVIQDDKPKFLSVDELLRQSTEHTRDLIKLELLIELNELKEEWHFASLEKIFIEKRIYRDIEECETWEEIIATIHKGLKPFTKQFIREVTDEDVARLTEIKIKRISRFDSKKADDYMAKLDGLIDDCQEKMDNLTETAIAYFKEIKAKYGKGRDRKSEIRTFDTVQAAKVAIANAKLFVNMAEGFIGTGLKRDEGEFVEECSDIDDIIVFRRDGKRLVTRITAKSFVGKDIIYCAVWKKDDKRTIYNVIYKDGRNGAMMKRFAVTAITRDKEYDLTKGAPGSDILYFSANPNGEAEVVTVHLRALDKLKKLTFDVDFAQLAVKGRDAVGNIVTKYAVKKVELKEKGVSTLGARSLWYDASIKRLNDEGRGEPLGDFMANDKLLILMSTGDYQLVTPELTMHFEESTTHIEKWMPDKPISAVYFDGDKEQWMVKRFLAEQSKGLVRFITEHPKSKLGVVSTLHYPKVYVRFNKKFKQAANKMDETVDLREFIAIKGVKAIGNRLTQLPILNLDLLEADMELENKANEELMLSQVQNLGNNGEEPSLFDQES
jgi:topoisomerase-4 subunit A